MVQGEQIKRRRGRKPVAIGGPDPVDVHVGRRLRERRLSLGWSQSELGRALDLTFQQIQKYERGSNRVSASMLYKAATAMAVPVYYFFDGFAEDGQGAPAPAPPLPVDGAIAQEIAALGPEVQEGFKNLVEALSRRR
ncbi:MAG TPA: helix-turn-helix transcriptional regulator [Alphaproteobacteria bacterium]|nr:helix-turn-helix transcriptional regulator [Alphaproteobacteria bacterium]